MEVPWLSGTCPNYPHIWLPFASKPTFTQEISTPGFSHEQSVYHDACHLYIFRSYMCVNVMKRLYIPFVRMKQFWIWANVSLKELVSLIYFLKKNALTVTSTPVIFRPGNLRLIAIKHFSFHCGIVCKYQCGECKTIY